MNFNWPVIFRLVPRVIPSYPSRRNLSVIKRFDFASPRVINPAGLERLRARGPEGSLLNGFAQRHLHSQG